MADLLVQILLISGTACIVWGQQTSNVPNITDLSALQGASLKETTPLNEVLGTFRAYDPDGTAVTFEIFGDGFEYFNVDKTSGLVTLKARLDFEIQDQIRSQVRVTDENGQSSSEDVITKVTDENDEFPQFTSTTLEAELSEDESPGLSILRIEVTDLDSKGGIITVKCNGRTPLQLDACATFELRKIEDGNKRWVGDLYLGASLDYESRKTYVIPLEANDGLNTQRNEVKIRVKDVNDAPPVWDKTGPKTIDEEQPIGTPITVVTARDQDTENKRQIFYELIGDYTDFFTIGNLSGVISNSVRLDFDSANSQKDKPYDITIRAREIISQATATSPMVLGSDSSTTATIDIKITLRDINDNSPEFVEDGKIKTSYTVFIDENIASGQNIPGLLMTVTDRDQTAVFNTFDLDTDGFQDIFRIIPEEDSASTSPTMYVVDGNKIDYESGPRTYVIEVTAIESRTSPAHTGSTTVTINVRNVNDETPRFEKDSYRVNITEGARGSTPVVLVKAFDEEEGPFGESGIRYKLLANIQEHFTIDPITGQISVKECDTPGVFPCIDYEKRKQYILTVSATDNGGTNGLSRSVQVIIDILDENDNQPRMDQSYLRYIYEGSTVTINPLVIEAEDPDTVGGPVTYALGDSTGLWKITMQTDPTDGTRSANVTATRAIRYRDATDQTKGELSFNIVALDKKSSTTAKITIIIIDINDNAPFFLAPPYRVPLSEDTKSEISLIRVSANDLDAPTTGNGLIDFSIRSGGAGKFQLKNARMDPSDGIFSVDVFTTQFAEFDYGKQNVYNLILLARDEGTPQSLTGTASLIVQITDSNNVVPVISPTSITINVGENSPRGLSVHKINAADPDTNKVLRYFMNPETATTPTGARAQANFKDLFKVDEKTGIVTVNGPLDRDLVAFITNEVTVEDRGSNPVQTGSGALFIRITEFNDQDPDFVGAPYNVTLDEEKTRNSYVLNLECRDADDDIAEYQISQVSPRFPQYFTLLPETGAVIVNERIDYETLNVDYITLSATCTDTGQPARTATTSVYAYIRNINDNSPIFTETFYRHTLEERQNTPREAYLLTVKANDIDKGDYGVVQYEFTEDDPFFRIDNKGNIYIKQNATFDRESSPTYDLQVVAYDSPLDESVRRNTTAPVYIAISDINDNCPIFIGTDHSAVIPESYGINTNIMDIVANDLDIGRNGFLTFFIEPNSGEPRGAELLFSLRSGENYGRISTAVPLKDRVGIKRFNVTATDGGLVPCSTTTQVTIDIIESQNKAPEWERPPRSKYEIYVLESQYRGMLVYNAKARDANQGPSGVIDYFFSVNGELVSNTAEFRINRITGVIRADVVFDREQVDTYFLTLVAQDQGTPSASSLTTLEVIILNVDDNDPKFRMKNGEVQPLVLSVRDNVGSNSNLGNCSYLATDADEDPVHNPIYYRLLTTSKAIEDHVTVDRETCVIRLINAVDYELHPTLEFEILAFNEKNDDSVVRYQKRAVNPSILPVVIAVTDVNDNDPVFSKDTYLACVSVDAPYKETILQVQATDLDLGDTNRLQYSLVTGTDSFGMDQRLGTIFNKISFGYGNQGQRQFLLSVSATDPDGRNDFATAVIFVTDSSNLVKLKVERPRVDVEPFKELLISTIKSNSGGEIAFACIDSVNNHETSDGDESTAASDVYVMAAKKRGGNYEIIPSGELSDMIGAMMEKEDNTLSDVYVAQVEAKDDSDDWDIDEDEVLVIFIICILLILLAIILLCLGCFCIHNSKKKKVRKLKAERHTIVEVGRQPVQTSTNPVYFMGSDNVEYATVQKGRHSQQPSQESPITPVVIPASENVKALPYDISDEPQPPEIPIPQVPLEEPVPVIETEVIDPPSKPVLEFPEYEDKIETTVVEDETPSVPESPKEPETVPEPQTEDIPSAVPTNDEDIEVEIKDTPPASPKSERKAED